MISDFAYLDGYKGPNYKICLIGDGGVGKTAIVENLLGQPFHTSYVLTIGADITTHEVEFDNYHWVFQLWDMAGQDRFNIVRTLYFKGSHAAILVYDRTRQKSLDNLKKWRNELFLSSGRKTPFIILGNKSDLPSKTNNGFLEKFIDESQREFKIPFKIHYMNTSAKTGENTKEALILLAQIIRDYILAHQSLNI